MQVHGALVHCGVRAGGLDAAEHLAGARVDQDERVGGGRAERHPGGRVVVGSRGNVSGRALAEIPGAGELVGIFPPLLTEDGPVGLGQRRLVRRAEEMLGVDLRAVRIEDRGLNRAL